VFFGISGNNGHHKKDIFLATKQKLTVVSSRENKRLPSVEVVKKLVDYRMNRDDNTTIDILAPARNMIGL